MDKLNVRLKECLLVDNKEFKNDVPIRSACQLVSKKESGCRQTRRAIVMTKRNARQQRILHRISSIRAFTSYIMLSRKLWRNQRNKDIRTVDATALIIIEEAVIVLTSTSPLRRHSISRVPWSSVLMKKKKKKKKKSEREEKKKIGRFALAIAAFIDFKTSRRVATKGHVKARCNFLALVTPWLKIILILCCQTPYWRRWQTSIIHVKLDSMVSSGVVVHGLFWNRL